MDKFKELRELRKAIAVNIMGWVERPDHQDYLPPLEQRTLSEEETSAHYYSFPYYEADIATSWEVVEALKARGALFKMRSYFDNAIFQYGAVFKSSLFDKWPSYHGADSMPEAICKAALAVVKAERKANA